MAQKEAQIRLLEGQLRQTDVIGSSHNHMILDALREKAEYIPELQALIHNVQQGELCSSLASFFPLVFLLYFLSLPVTTCCFARNTLLTRLGSKWDEFLRIKV